MRKGTFGLLVFLGIVWILFPFAWVNAETIKIGTLFPLSGPMALLGHEMFRGSEIARIMQNEKGGLWGREIVYAKADAPDATAAVAEAERLITIEGVKVIMGSYASSLAHAASAVAEKYGVLYWEYGGTAVAITQRGFKYLFRFIPDSEEQGSKPVIYAAKVIAPALKIEPKDLRIALMHEDTLYGTSVAAAVRQTVKEMGVQLIASEAYSQKSVDLSPIVLRFKALNPDVVIAASYISDAILFWRQAKELNFVPKAFIGCGAGHGLPDFAVALGDEVNGVFNLDPSIDINPAGLKPEAQALLKEFKERYRAAYGRDPVVHAGLGFAGANFLFQHVLPKAGSLNPDNIREAALSLDVPDGSTIGGFGVKFAPLGHPKPGQNIRAFFVMHQWQGQKLRVVYPEELATTKPVIPLPPWGQRKDLGLR